jgi:hypothetical protein
MKIISYRRRTAEARKKSNPAPQNSLIDLPLFVSLVDFFAAFNDDRPILKSRLRNSKIFLLCGLKYQCFIGDTARLLSKTPDRTGGYN